LSTRRFRIGPAPTLSSLHRNDRERDLGAFAIAAAHVRITGELQELATDVGGEATLASSGCGAKRGVRRRQGLLDVRMLLRTCGPTHHLRTCWFAAGRCRRG
jgi:hypothetical protein